MVDADLRIGVPGLFAIDVNQALQEKYVTF
jgi:hypothetical protein